MNFIWEEEIGYLNMFWWNQTVLAEIYPKTTFWRFLRIVLAAPKFGTFFLTNFRFWEIGSCQLKVYSFPVNSDSFRTSKKSRSVPINQLESLLTLVVRNCRSNRKLGSTRMGKRTPPLYKLWLLKGP